jgi:WD40 repeat protein
LRLSDLARFEAAPAAFAGTPLWLTPQSDRLVTLTRDGTVVVWNVAGASELRRVDPQSAHRSSNNPEASAELFTEDAAGIVGAALSSSGRTLATMSKRTVRFWDIASGAELTQRRFDVSNPGDQGPLDTLVAIHASFVNPERFLLLLTSDLEDGYYRAVLMHADADGSSRTVTRDTSARASGLAVARRGGRVAINVRSTDADIGLYAGQSRVLVFDEEGVGGPVHTHTLAQRGVTAIDLDAEGQRLVMAIAPNAVRVVGAATGALLAEWATDSPSSFVAFHPDGNLVLLVSNEGRAALHRVDPGRPTLILRPEDNRVRLPHVRSLQRQGDAIIYGWKRASTRHSRRTHRCRPRIRERHRRAPALQRRLSRPGLRARRIANGRSAWRSRPDRWPRVYCQARVGRARLVVARGAPRPQTAAAFSRGPGSHRES